MDKLIVRKWTTACTLPNFDYVHYFEHYFLSIFFTPKHFQFLARGSLCGSFVTNSLEGYRILVPIKTNQNTP